jgi:hypothetical protein
MSYIRFAWFTLKNNTTGEVYPQRIACNPSGWAKGEYVHKIVDHAIENDSVVIGGPFKTRKEALA